MLRVLRVYLLWTNVFLERERDERDALALFDERVAREERERAEREAAQAAERQRIEEEESRKQVTETNLHSQ